MDLQSVHYRPEYQSVLPLRPGLWKLVASLGEVGGEAGGRARQLAYLLNKIANDNGWSEEASVYNGLIPVWPVLRKQSPKSKQGTLLDS